MGDARWPKIDVTELLWYQCCSQTRVHGVRAAGTLLGAAVLDTDQTEHESATRHQEKQLVRHEYVSTSAMNHDLL